ncbi:hypothetical protein DFH09DRAFT_1335464 [Mycena vulgaris]|nr:hypothetical protein DFH09DRAFT_1335464 [Mycena vulgaris]
MFPYPPPPGMFYSSPLGFPPQPTPTPSTMRPKRNQVKMACTDCAQACKCCDDTRPCARCLKYNMGDSCVDGQRKERKKGVKRGPYKRRARDGDSPPAPAEGASTSPIAA